MRCSWRHRLVNCRTLNCLRSQRGYLPAIWLLLLTLPVTLTFAALRGIVQGRGSFYVISRERIAGVMLRLIALVAFVWLGLLSPISGAWISVLSGAAGSLILLPALRPFANERSSADGVKAIACFASAIAIGTVGGLLMLRLDQVLMISLTNHAELGYYAVAVSLAELPMTVVGAIRDITFTIAAGRDDPQGIARICRLTVLCTCAICFVGVLTAPIIIPLLFGLSFGPAVPMAQILLVGSIGSAITAVMGAGLMTSGKTWLRSGMQIAAAALTAILLLAFVPHWGGIGASWVTTLTYGTLALASLIAYSRSAGVTLWQCLVPTWADFATISF